MLFKCDSLGLLDEDKAEAKDPKPPPQPQAATVVGDQEPSVVVKQGSAQAADTQILVAGNSRFTKFFSFKFVITPTPSTCNVIQI